MSPDAIAALTTILGWSLLGLGLVFLLSGLDDLMVDVLALAKHCGPSDLDHRDLNKLRAIPERPIAVIIPAWDEAGIIRRMLTGNLAVINYRNYHIFVGCYPNDSATLSEVQAVAAQHRHVHAVINTQDGPTSKGQALNAVVAEILEFEVVAGWRFAALQMQDAEDLIHPLALKLVNRALDDCDLIQIPVFSLPVGVGQWVGSTYIDEFAEHHTKDLLLRSRIGAGVPSAGVGTCLSQRLVDVVTARHGTLFSEDSLTEDYELGLRAHRLGLTARFLCVGYREPNSGRRELIATREYFPDRLPRAVRQKGRWVTGICFQGWGRLGWFGGIATRWFLWRDRKAPFVNLVNLLGYLLLVAGLWEIGHGEGAVWSGRAPVEVVLTLCGLLMVNRLVWRVVSVHRVYGRWGLTLTVPLRVPVANLINAGATLRALVMTGCSRLLGRRLRWCKTSHRLPVGFGSEVYTDDAA